ncbi:IDEAL domain-containing protein [Neobacillus niacini]|uniref:IDEAL domain-containing protein n=1 Tax=Neobacillus niacini TaxID=86668 RepID=UPI0021CB298A|nr:IDEAL domain-containing protein [Neobacillus niacini]MCM3763985.1 IDEAL domain-containing protein [Neobacillus niacini]
MKKLICKYCGNKEFYVLTVHETLCKCGMHLTKPSDYRLEDDHKWKELYQLEHKREASLISRISLLKRAIDKCLDERDQAGFQKLTAELRTCQNSLRQPRTRLKERLNGKSLT